MVESWLWLFAASCVPTHDAKAGDSGVGDAVPADSVGVADSKDSGVTGADSGTQDSASGADTSDSVAGSPPCFDTGSATTVAYGVADVAKGAFRGSSPYDAEQGNLGPRIAVAGGSDVTGDGQPDLVVGLPGTPTDAGSVSSGEAYIVTGDGTFAVQSRLAVGEGHVSVGYSLALPGDVTGDGEGDLVIGAPWGGEPYAGEALVVPGIVTGDVDLGTRGYALTVPQCPEVGYESIDSYFGWAVAAVGDLDGDGTDDLAITAFGSCWHNVRIAHGPIMGSLDMSVAADSTIEATDDLFPGITVSSMDQDGDGVPDIATLGRDATLESDTVFIATGPVVATLSVADITTRVNIDPGWGDDVGDDRFVGDVDGDGYPDLLVGTPDPDSAAGPGGGAFLFRGPIIATLTQADAYGTFLDPTADDHAGHSVANVGDLDGDGHDDVAIGAYGADSDAGAVYVLHGPFCGTWGLDHSDLILTGSAGSYLGEQVTGVGDIDGDGLADLMIGAPGDDTNGYMSGAAWLVTGASLL